MIPNIIIRLSLILAGAVTALPNAGQQLVKRAGGVYKCSEKDWKGECQLVKVDELTYPCYGTGAVGSIGGDMGLKCTLYAGFCSGDKKVDISYRGLTDATEKTLGWKPSTWQCVKAAASDALPEEQKNDEGVPRPKSIYATPPKTPIGITSNQELGEAPKPEWDMGGGNK